MDDLSPYEREREAIINSNRARLAALGLARAASALGVGPAEPSKPPPKPKRAPPSRKEPERPTRASKRLRGDAADVKREPTSPERSPSPSPPPAQKWTDAELRQFQAEKEAVRVARQDARLEELDMAGLISFGPGAAGDCGKDVPPPRVAARFAVVGAPHKGKKRKHYIVALAADPYSCSCECMDWRFRHKSADNYACKHVRLILTQLACVDAPAEWESALETRVMGDVVKRG